MEITKATLKRLNATIAAKGIMEVKGEMILQFTGGRTERSSKLTESEGQEMCNLLNASKGDRAQTVTEMQKDRMARNIIAMAHELGWIKRGQVMTKDGLRVVNDYSALNEWMLKYGYLHKPLNQYTFSELPELVTQFKSVYSHYLKKG